MCMVHVIKYRLKEIKDIVSEICKRNTISTCVLVVLIIIPDNVIQIFDTETPTVIAYYRK